MQGQVETLDTYIPRGTNRNTHGNFVLFEFPWKQCLWYCSVIREKKWVINNKEANVVSLGLAEQLQALRQMNWIEMEDSSCNTNAYYRLCFITGKPTLLLKLHNVMVPNYILLTIITTKDLASLDIIGYAIFTLVICRILTCLFKKIQPQFAFCSSSLHISTRNIFVCLYLLFWIPISIAEYHSYNCFTSVDMQNST